MSNEVEQGHSPLPWKIHGFKSSYGGDDLLVLNHVGKHPAGRNWGSHVETSDGTTICQTDGDTSEEAIANAQLIVTAVNAYATQQETASELYCALLQAVSALRVASINGQSLFGSQVVKNCEAAMELYEAAERKE